MSEARRLRILQILRAPVGGLFRHVADLTTSLAARGHQIGIVADSLSADGLTETRLEALRPCAALGIHRWPMPRLIGPGDLATPWRVRRLADRLNIDVLHGHGAKGGLTARLSAPGGRHRRVALYTPHGGVLHFDMSKPAGKLFRAIERGMLGATDAIIFESEFAKKSFAERIAAPACPAPVIHNGLAEPEFAPVGTATGSVDFVFIGELRTLKGIDVLIDALPPLRGRDGRPARLVMAGDGPDRARLVGRIAALGLDDRVELVGVRPAREMLARGFCLVVPSLAESLPYVVLEAAAAGRPIIATRVGGIAEIFGPTASSLVPAGDAEALREAMRQALETPDAAVAEASTRRDFVRENFSLSRMTEEIESLYFDLLLSR